MSEAVEKIIARMEAELDKVRSEEAEAAARIALPIAHEFRDLKLAIWHAAILQAQVLVHLSREPPT